MATALCPGEAWHWVELLIQQLAFCSRSLLGTHRHALVPSLLEGPPAVLYKGGVHPSRDRKDPCSFLMHGKR